MQTCIVKGWERGEEGVLRTRESVFSDGDFKLGVMSREQCLMVGK